MTILAALGVFALGAAAMWGALRFIDWLFFAPIDPPRPPRELGAEGYRFYGDSL
jgi:nitrate reductase NapE component